MNANNKNIPGDDDPIARMEEALYNALSADKTDGVRLPRENEPGGEAVGILFSLLFFFFIGAGIYGSIKFYWL